MKSKYSSFFEIFALVKVLKTIRIKLLDRGLHNLSAKHYCLRYWVQVAPSKRTITSEFLSNSNILIYKKKE